MSGGYVPYHFRQNKAIDRHLFIELLHRLQKQIDIRNYRYVGFGGPFLEDMKLMHAHFGLDTLISLESDARVLRRQQFNKPISCVTLVPKRSREFVDEDGFAVSTILWLDYATPSQLRAQLEEIQMVTGKMGRRDVLKVTFNANMSAYIPDLAEKNGVERAAAFKVKVGRDYFPSDLPEGAFDNVADFPAVLLKAFERAAKRGTAGIEYLVQPLATYVYSDGNHQMLTVTGIILETDDDVRREFLEVCSLSQWEFATTTWQAGLTHPKQIRIPDLSVRERLYLDTHLPKLRKDKRLARRVLGKIGPALTDKQTDEEVALQQYAQFYRHFPYLSRIII